MAEYRAYILDNEGHIAGFEPIVCACDEEAIKIARRQVDRQHDVELWSGSRFVILLQRPPSAA